nr:flagellar hook-associated protein FlgK [Fretibacterium sp.]
MSTFAGIEMGKRALNAFRLGMQTVGHNISNMETEGYSRQRVNYSTVQPMDLPGIGQVGQGVQVDEIVRIRDEFLDFQYRSNQATLGYWDKINELYDTIQNYIAEPAGEGVRSAMNTFFDAMQSVQLTPEDAAARRNLVESAQSLGNMLDSLVNGFETYNKAVNQEVQSSVDEANEILYKIAALNKQIYHAEALDQNANDLLDQRDLLLDKISSMIDVTYNEPMGDNPTGEFFLTLNGRALIQGDHVRELKAHAFQWDGQVYYDVQVAENEFDIVSNCMVADVLTTGPEGVHQLNVDRISNYEEWEVGGGDALCLETRALTTSEFDGFILDGTDEENRDTRTLTFRTLVDTGTNADGTKNMEPVTFKVSVTWNTDKWEMTTTDEAGNSITGDSSDAKLSVQELGTYLQKVIDEAKDSSDNTYLKNSGLNVSTTDAKFEVQGATITDTDGILSGDLFNSGVILDGTGTTDKTLTFEKNGTKVNVKLTWDTTDEKWTMSAFKEDGTKFQDSNGNDIDITEKSAGATLKLSELTSFLNDKVFVKTTGMNGVTASSNGPSLTITAGTDHMIEVTDGSGMLGMLQATKVAKAGNTTMRSRPMSVDEALGVTGSFRIQVGSQGTRVYSQPFKNDTLLADGEILGEPKEDEATTHTFRIGVSDQQIDITAVWNSKSEQWELSSDVFAPGVNTGDFNVYPVPSGTTLSVTELTDFIKEAAEKVPDANLNVTAYTNDSGVAVQFSVESTDYHLISISDVEGNLAEKMGMANPNPVITIDVAETDSLTIIRNKINEKYQEEFGLTEPEQWVHASLQQDSDQSWYLSIAADVAGEAQRITLMGEEGGSMQLLRRLGLTANVDVGKLEDGTPVYREVSAIATESQDASFTFDNVHYLSSDNMFKTARRIPASDSKTDYTASQEVEVSEGMWFNLKNAGITTVTSRHHVKGGSVKALEEARDELIPDLKGTLDEVAYGLVKNLNAYQYSGYGIGDDITMTGVAFFDPLSTKAGAAKALSVSDKVVADNALIGAAMGQKGEDGKAVSGVSGGSGDGTNAGRMNGLSSARILKDGTVSLGGEYDAMLAEIGSKAGNAQLMY